MNARARAMRVVWALVLVAGALGWLSIAVWLVGVL